MSRDTRLIARTAQSFSGKKRAPVEAVAVSQIAKSEALRRPRR
jgi:hypothetical protein